MLQPGVNKFHSNVDTITTYITTNPDQSQLILVMTVMRYEWRYSYTGGGLDGETLAVGVLVIGFEGRDQWSSSD